MQYSKFRPEAASDTETEPPSAGQMVLPALIVGFALTAALLVLLLLTQSQLSRIGFAVSALERERDALEIENEKLRVTHARVYSLERIEQEALALGMVRPAPGQYIEIEIE